MAELIETRGLSKRYGSTLALDRLDLGVGAGEVFGFLGPNGAGKTTTIRLLLGVIRPSAGTARIFGLHAWDEAIQIHRRLSYVPSDLSLWPSLTGGQTLEFLGRLHGRIDAALREQLIERFEFDPSVKVRAYSRGNRQKIGIIAAFMTRPDVLVLDEPTAGLDPLMEMVFRDCVREARDRDQTVFLSSHLLSEVEALCDRVGILRAGRLTDLATLDDLRRLAATTVEAVFDGPVPDISAVPGVESVQAAGGRLRCEVRGPVGPLVDALAGSPLTSLVSREASLEESFLAYYGHDH